jgi:hypothetical protein
MDMIRHHHIRVQLVVMKFGCAFVKLFDDTSSDSGIFQPRGSRIGTVKRRIHAAKLFACGNCAPHANSAAQSSWH